ncbi:MAG: hypothetical protein V2A69_15940 [Pseudomonadota bacterium]
MQIDELQPLLVKIIEEFKKGPKDAPALDMILTLLKQKEYLESAVHIAYITVEKGNESIMLDGVEVALFTEEEFKQWIPLDVLLQIIKVIWSQNFEKNPFTGSKLKKVDEKPVKKVIKETEATAAQ